MTLRATTWIQRTDFMFREGIYMSKQEIKARKLALETACLRRFIAGPQDDNEYDRVRFDMATRTVEPVLNARGAVVGESVVYSAPMDDK
jgi:hypothetical protein